MIDFYFPSVCVCGGGGGVFNVGVCMSSSSIQLSATGRLLDITYM